MVLFIKMLISVRHAQTTYVNALKVNLDKLEESTG